MGATVLGTGHPVVSHLVGAGAVEVQLGGLLSICLGWVEGGNTARTGEAGGGHQEIGADRSCCPGCPCTWNHRQGMGKKQGLPADCPT